MLSFRVATILLLSLAVTHSFAQWKGYVKKVTKTTTEFLYRETTIDLSFTSAIPTLYRNVETTDLNFTDDKGTGTSKDHYETNMGNCTCTGQGVAQLHEVVVDKAGGTYSISAIALFPCKGGTDGDGSCSGDGTFDIGISDQPLGSNPNILSGSETVVRDIGIGKATITLTWHLERVFDAVFIISPERYDDWLPLPGRDELSKGGMMKLNLKVQRRDGRPLPISVQEFELRLTKTSREPGITLNSPLNPSAQQLPDLRFIPHAIAESNGMDQVITIKSRDGRTGTALIASYDGGGYTTLTGEAFLDGDIRIQGELLVPGGEHEIPVPKRDTGSNIAKAWLLANGDPLDNDDKEFSPDCPNDGDGLSAYEEYRGVISQGTFKRLDPQKKELGVWGTRADMQSFSEGMVWLERAAGIKVVRFVDSEIDTDRKLNRNIHTSNIHKQYVQNIVKGKVAEGVGENQPIEVTGKIPFQSKKVLIDVNKISIAYNLQVRALAGTNTRMPYTLQEQIANTVAHELAHGIGVDHHGPLSNVPNITIPNGGYDVYNLYDSHNNPIIVTRPYLIPGLIGKPGNDESGNLDCIMAYTGLYQWAYRPTLSSFDYYSVPLLAVGKIFCNSPDGSGINENQKYFGDATFGNCLSQIKFK